MRSAKVSRPTAAGRRAVRNSHSLTTASTPVGERAQHTHRASAAVVPAPPSCRPAIRSHPRAPLDEPVVRPVVEWPVEMGRQAVRSRKIKGQPGNYRRDVALSGIASIFKEADRPTIFIVFGTALSGFCCDAPEGARALPEITLVQYRS